MISQYQHAPATPASQKSNRQLHYDYNTSNGTSVLRNSPSQESPSSARFISSPPPAVPGSRPSTSTGGPSSAVIPRPGTAQTVQPRERSTSNSTPQSYWGPLPRGYNNEAYDMGSRPAFYKRHSYTDYENLGPQIDDSDTQALDPTPRSNLKQASVDPFPTDVQRIPVNADSPLHQMHYVRRAPSDSLRSLRYDTKKRSYRFDDLSDIESEKGPRGGGGGSFYRNGRSSTPVEEILRLPMTWWMNSTAKNHFVAMIGEFVGTTMFLFFAFAGTQVANIQTAATTTTTNATNGFSPIVLLYTAVSFGFSLMVNVWIFFRISGGLFNPAVTLAMVMVKSLDYVRGSLLFLAQISGSLLASVLVRALFPTPLNVRTTLSADTSKARGVFIEAILTAELVFTIFMLAKEKHRATYMAPVGIGLSLFIAELVGVFYTGGSLNPARSFGPCAVTGVWDQEHWIYWLGPALGALIAVVFYKFIKILEYEIANPGQDAEREDEELPLSRDGVWRKKDEEA
ncbi:aquaporin-like protein [Aureobasidium sp. EXF-3400]|nr:aquaporin-like protein [Aureobasidium sp. EXF-12344]KAI4784244.1 aquaporin-like protein [Aureobasidium sp. EXF-3400]